MLDQYATGMAMRMALEQHKQRRDLLMFSALPDAPVRPVDPPTRAERVRQRLASWVGTRRRTSRGGDSAARHHTVTGSPSAC